MKRILWIILYIILIPVYLKALYENEEDTDSHLCSAELRCDEQVETVSMIVRGIPGKRGPRGMTGQQGLIGPPGLPGPPGHDNFPERSIFFYAQLKHLFITKNRNSILRPWKLSDSFNTPDVSNYFSHKKGIFTVPESGLYQFFLTIAVSHAKASAYIRKNRQRMCTIWIESITTIHNRTIASGWSSNSIDCLIFCQSNDQISIIAVYHSNEHMNSKIYGYSYSTFSGYKLYKTKNKEK